MISCRDNLTPVYGCDRDIIFPYQSLSDDLTNVNAINSCNNMFAAVLFDTSNDNGGISTLKWIYFSVSIVYLTTLRYME